MKTKFHLPIITYTYLGCKTHVYLFLHPLIQRQKLQNRIFTYLR